jgi:hypothetical protein
MPSKKSVITVKAQSEDGPLQVEVAIPLRRRRQRTSLEAHRAPAAESPGPLGMPRITRLMALAIKFQDLIDRREVLDYADIARLGYVTRARLTQLMNLLHLAPDIQERLLNCQDPQHSTSALTERDLREVSRIVDWSSQRHAFSLITK